MRGKILPRLSARLRVIRAGASASASDARSPGRPPPTAAENPRPSSNGPKRFLQNPASPEGWRLRPGCSPADLRSGPEAAAARPPSALEAGAAFRQTPHPAFVRSPLSPPHLTPTSRRPPGQVPPSPPGRRGGARSGLASAKAPARSELEAALPETGALGAEPPRRRRAPPPPPDPRRARAAALRRRPDRAQERRPPLILGEGRRPRRRPGKPHRRPRAIPWPRAEVAPGHRQQAASSPPRARPVRRRNPRTSSATPRLSSTPPSSAAGAGSTGPVLAR